MANITKPAVITIMGHVDHGKTTLLDYIRNSSIVSREAGGITQHIGAYTIDYKDKKLTFIDTPGHAAFNKMRERGAKVTDLIVLVVAANDGVKPQTIESIRHIKNANVPFVVAINKTDLENIDLNLAKSGLAEHGIVVRDYGGDIDTVEISALKGIGVDKLLETLLVMADLAELKADPELPLEAVVIESSKDSQRGCLASVIVQQGTLKIRQDIYTTNSSAVLNPSNSSSSSSSSSLNQPNFSSGSSGYGAEASGRVKLLSDSWGNQVSQVLPGIATEIVGFKTVPAVGSLVRDSARSYTNDTSASTSTYAHDASANTNTQANKANFDSLDLSSLDLADDINAFFDQTAKLKLIVKADVEGTLEAIMQNLDPDSTDVIAHAVGEVTESELELAKATQATVIVFGVKVKSNIKNLAKSMKVKIKQYDVIYKLIEDLQKLQLKLMDATIDEVELGKAEIMQIFEMKGQKIAGCKVISGVIRKIDSLHLLRDGNIIADPKIKSMMHGKEEISEAKAKKEMGLVFAQKNLDFQIGDVLLAYTVEDDA